MVISGRWCLLVASADSIALLAELSRGALDLGIDGVDLLVGLNKVFAWSITRQGVSVRHELGVQVVLAHPKQCWH